MNSTEIYQAKRHLLYAGEKLVAGLPKPRQKFYRDLFYGLSKSRTVILSDIARALEEPIDVAYTIKRLSNQIDDASDLSSVHENYLQMIQKYIHDEAVVIVDESDITKPYATKMEALGQVRDGSTGKIEKGYQTINFSVATPHTKHPIPLYHSLFSAQEEGFESTNVETAKGLNVVNRLFGDHSYTLIMDRGYDSNQMYDYIHSQNRQFIVRLKDNRYLIHRNRRIKVPELANRRKGKIAFSTQIKGTQYDLKVSHINVQLPALKDTPLNMVVVYGYGKNPMKLLTNRDIKSKKDVLRILKAYITRWRIEELFRVQKEEFHLEKMRTMTLDSLRILFHMVNYLIGHYSMSIEKGNLFTRVVLARAKASNPLVSVKFYLYRFIRGISNILTFDTVGIRHFHSIERRKGRQLALF